jgi:uncharacterized delta-60 repeat protein
MKVRLNPHLVSLCTFLIFWFLISARDYARSASIDEAFHSPLITKQAPAERVVVLPDDSFLAFRSFTRLSGLAVGPLVKFRSGGARDQSFHFSGDYFSVSALSSTTDGHLIIAAAQQDKSGRNYYRIVKLNLDGSVDGSLNSGSGADADVRVLQLDSAKIVAGGYFTRFNGQNRACILRLNADGSTDSSFAAPSFASTNPVIPKPFVRAEAIQPSDGKYLVGGLFSSVNGTVTHNLVRLNANGSVDTSFSPSGFQLYAHGTIRESPVTDIALRNDDKILISGQYFLDDNNFIPRYPLLRLDTNGSADHFYPGTQYNSSAQTIKLLPDQSILSGEYYLYRFDPDDGVSAGYPKNLFSTSDLETVARVFDIDAQSSGSFLLAGPEFVSGLKRSGLARLNANGTLDSFYAGEFQADALPDKLVTAPDGKIYVSGAFDRIDGQSRVGFARLKANGTLDSAFSSVVALGYSKVKVFCLQPDGRILIGGLINSGPLEGYFGYQRFWPNGQLDTSFRAENDITFGRADLEPDGSYRVSPTSPYEFVFNTALGHIYPDGHFHYNEGINVTIHANAMDGIEYVNTTHVYFGENRALVFYKDSSFIAKYFDRSRKYHVVRVKPNGEIDSTFHSAVVDSLRMDESGVLVQNADPILGTVNVYVPLTIAQSPTLNDAAILPDGKIIIVGMFTKYNNVPAPGIVRLLANGNIDPTFHPGGGAQWTTTQVDTTHVPQIDSVKVQQNGQLLITGNFEAYNGMNAPGIALLNSDGTLAPLSSPVTLRNFGPFAKFPDGKLYREGAGNYLLTGRYAKNGETSSRSLLRIKLPALAEAMNVSTRARVETGDNVLIGGFVITGNEAKRVIVRAIGPSLTSAGVANALTDPVLELHKPDGTIVTNDNWRTSQQAEILATGFAPRSNFESAIVATLPPGNYTAIVRGKNDTSGIALVEANDLDQTVDSSLANISARSFVQSGDNVMIGGIVVGPSGTNIATMLLRAVGPSLATFGIHNPLPDPVLELHNGNGQLIGGNDNWKTNQQAAIQATGLAPKNDKESAIFARLAPGNYTAVVRGKNNMTGIALVEVYRVQ